MFAGVWTRGISVGARPVLARPICFRALHRSATPATIVLEQLPRNITRISGTSAKPLSGLLARSGIWNQERHLTVRAGRRPPFDPRFFSSNASAAPIDLPVLSPPPVAGWLLVSSVLVFAVIVVGGVTRLTESGLSITEWRPITGILPPLSQVQWNEEFTKYKATPEFKLYVFTIL